MKHFKLTSNFITNTFGTKLFQLQLNIDCKFGKKGDLGGYVEKVEILQGEDAWLYKDASACGDAIIRGGEIRGGVIRGGVIFGGEICGGVIWKTPLQFCSGRHYAIVSQPGWLKIGCKQFTFDYWGDNFKKIGEDEGYSEIEIIQYKIIIEMAKKFGDDCFKKIE